MIDSRADLAAVMVPNLPIGGRAMRTELVAELAEYPVVVTIPVQWGDQDAFGHVNNIVYFRWFESARVAYCARIGLWHRGADDPLGPILASVKCDYRRPLNFPDTVQIGARITRLGKSSLTMEHRIISAAHGTIVADGSSVVVIYDYNANASRPIPAQLRQVIAALEGRTFDG